MACALEEYTHVYCGSILSDMWVIHVAPEVCTYPERMAMVGVCLVFSVSVLAAIAMRHHIRNTFLTRFGGPLC